MLLFGALHDGPKTALFLGLTTQKLGYVLMAGGVFDLDLQRHSGLLIEALLEPKLSALHRFPYVR